MLSLAGFMGGSAMIFVFIGDGTLDVIENIETAQRNYEAIDVESGAYVFYDSEGNYLEPELSVPNKSGKFLGLFQWYQSGVFQLRLNPEKHVDPFWVNLSKTSHINANKWFKSLDEVKLYLQNKGVHVEQTN
jgi:hypothetical protein